MRLKVLERKFFIAVALMGLGIFAAAPLAARTSRQSQTGTQKAAAPAAKAAPEYVGADTCKVCHVDESKELELNPHHKTLLNKDKAKQGCEACHGPGSVHVASGGQTQLPFDFNKMDAQEISDRCMTCHQSRQENMHFLTSAHAHNRISCTDCHSVHHSSDRNALLVKQEPNLCYSCHRQIQPMFRMPFHHKVDEGMVRCSDCHNPHGGFVAAALNPGGENVQLRSGPAGSAVCTTCHADKSGPFVFNHEPVVTDGCLACHNPHGSPNPHMLKVANVNQLCLECHTQSSFSAAPGTPSFHSQTTQFQACTLCHTRIHGSNFSPDFFK